MGKFPARGDLRVPLQHILSRNSNAVKACVSIVALCEATKGLGANVTDLDVVEGGVILQGADRDDEEVGAY